MIQIIKFEGRASHSVSNKKYQHRPVFPHRSSTLPGDPGAGLREPAVGQAEADEGEVGGGLIGQVPRGRVLRLHRSRHLWRHRHTGSTRFPGMYTKLLSACGTGTS